MCGPRGGRARRWKKNNERKIKSQQNLTKRSLFSQQLQGPVYAPIGDDLTTLDDNKPAENANAEIGGGGL